MKIFWHQQQKDSASDLSWMVDELSYMLSEMDKIVNEQGTLIKQIPDAYRLSAENLLHYLVFRSYDIRDMQDQLHGLGLSSLASAESHIRFQIEQVLHLLQRLQLDSETREFSSLTPHQASAIISDRRTHLLGNSQENHTPNLMVTFPPEAANDYALVKNLLEGGMNVARINLAHDTSESWLNMIQNLKKAELETGRSCKIYMDLPGPKIRTAALVKVKKKFKHLEKVRLKPGQLLLLTSLEQAEEADRYFEIRKGESYFIVGCTLPALLASAKVGDHIFFDDGKFSCRVEELAIGYLMVRVDRVPPKKVYLKVDKGINFPDSAMQPEPLTDADREYLPFVSQWADMVGYSFVGSAGDVMILQNELLKLSNNPPAIILKIERRKAVENLAELLLQGMQRGHFGVMIARGDLGIEVGFERLSEVQEEILWMCEAAHTPVIWATQVVESLNKTGMMTRAEISDVALASSADCIMLNKGAHILDALQTVRNIAQRMQGHMHKKRYILRPLSIARRFTTKAEL